MDRYLLTIKLRCLIVLSLIFMMRSLISRPIAPHIWCVCHPFLRNRVTQMVRTAKQRFYSPLLNTSIGSGKLWSNLRNIGIASARYNGSQSNFNANDNCDYLATIYRDTEVLVSTEDNTFALFVGVAIHDVAMALKKVKKVKSNAVGLDSIPLKFIKLIFQLYYRIFNACITTSSFPSQWKCAKVIPIPKMSASRNVVEHRPISILPTIVFERVRKDQMMNHPLNPLQHG